MTSAGGSILGSRSPTANSSCRARPLRLAWYIAWSELRIRSSGVASRPLLTAMPMLAVTVASWPSIGNGSRSASSMRSATADRVADVDDVLEQDRELVTAEARDGVLGAHAGAHALGHRRQQAVARRRGRSGR